MKILRIAVRFGLVFSIFAIALIVLPTSEAGQRPLSGALLPRQVRISDDENYVVFGSAVSLQDESNDLYAVRIEGGAPRRIARSIRNFSISPDNRYVYYTQPLTPTSQAESLYYIPITGGTPTLVDSAAYGFYLFESYTGDWLFTPNGQFLLYMAWRELDTPFVPLEFSRLAVGADAPPVLISDPAIPPTMVAIGDLQISPDGTTLAYTGQREDLSLQLVTIPILGGPSHVLTTPLESARARFAITPDSQRVVYSVGADPFEGVESLYSSRLDGSDRVLLRGGGQYSTAVFGAGGTSLFYGANEGANGNYVYEQPITGGAVVPRFGGPGVVLNNGSPFIGIDPAGEHLLFYASTDQTYLYSMPTTPGGVAVALSGSLPPEGGEWKVTPDGQRVLYQVYDQIPQPPSTQVSLYIAPIDGSSPAHYLYSDVYRYFINNDSTAIYFTVAPNTTVRLPLTDDADATVVYSGDATRRQMPVQLLANEQLLLVDHLPNTGDTQLWIADDALSAVGFTLSETFVEETDAVYTATVALDANSLQTVTVDIVPGDGTATQGSDFTFTPMTLTFAPGESEKSVTVTILADDEADDGETIILEAQNIEGGIPGSALSTTITLRETVYRTWLPHVTQ